MSMLRRYFRAVSLVLPLALAAQAAAAQAANPPRCQMGTREHPIEHVVYLQFDNVHLRRDNPNVPSDLEQIPNLLNFLKDQGTVLTNHHDPLISHTSVDIVTSLTGVYGEKFGFAVGNSYGEFQGNGVAAFPSSFAYWTDPSRDGLPQMVDQRGKIHPAPWVPFTRAGCNVGAFSLANIEFENVTSDVSTVFGPAIASAVAQETTNNGGDDTQAVSQFEGISIHCAKNSTLCAKAPACPATPVNGQLPAGCTAADLLPDEPGGYTGFNALFGNINVQPIISPKGPVQDLDGNVIANIANDGVTAFPGFPGFDPLPAQALGYVATMLEAGVPVVYFYIADAHDNQNISISGVDPNAVSVFGPGEQGYVNQLAAYNKAFGEFFARLKKDGITKDNTLFIVTADENDHFVGSAPSPAGCDGIHTPCTYASIGEVDGDLSLLFATEFGDKTPFRVHSDSAPTFYINGNPGQSAAVTRNLEQESGKLLGFDPVDGPNGGTNHVAAAIADVAEQKLLHMVTFDPNRTPNFILFGNDDYWLFASGHTTPLCTPATNSASCFIEEGPTGSAWNHGDFQNQITHTWLAIAGPGVQRRGEYGERFTDHTDIRPTMLSLTHLKDDYSHDGRTVFEVLDRDVLPDAITDQESLLSRLAEAYKQINAPRGLLGRKTLTGIATRAVESPDATYALLDQLIVDITARRNAIAEEMLDMLEGAEFSGRPVAPWRAEQLIAQAQLLLESVE
jgi:hypothetical protein